MEFSLAARLLQGIVVRSRGYPSKTYSDSIRITNNRHSGPGASSGRVRNRQSTSALTGFGEFVRFRLTSSILRRFRLLHDSSQAEFSHRLRFPSACDDRSGNAALRTGRFLLRVLAQVRRGPRHVVPAGVA